MSDQDPEGPSPDVKILKGSAGSGSFSFSPNEQTNLLATLAKTPSGSQHQTSFSSKASSEMKRKPSLNVILPKFGSHAHNGSSDSLNKSPHSPGSILEEESYLEDKELSYKVQRKNYRREKQRVAQELSSALKDPSIIILSSSLKVRGKLKGWTKLWAVLKPGLLFLYKSSKIKSSHWVATVLLHCCKVIERPSKKEGFCFKVFHPLEQSIWSTKGPEGETIGAVVQPLPTTYLICRVPSSDEGKCWMDGLELALTCSSLLVRSPRSSDMMDDKHSSETEIEAEWCGGSNSEKSDTDTSHVEEHDEALESEYEDHDERGPLVKDYSTNLQTEIAEVANHYTILTVEDFAHNTKGEHSEVLDEKNKSLLWFILKQIRPGMDLSRVVLPTFILEPRSFLDKLSDYYFHADLLSKAVKEDDPFERMKSILKWYMSGFYKKPKGLKKPYNPVLGEMFRCMWEHPNGSRTFYLAEQVSHHPPVSAYYVTNRKDGFTITTAILTKSKFYGNSTSAILEGVGILTLLPRGETYYITMPFAHCKGILLGTLSMELGGNVSIICEKTGYSTDMEFKLRSFFSRSDETNSVTGKIRMGKDVLSFIEGHWDSKISIKNKGSSEWETFWEVTDDVKETRLKRYTIPFEDQCNFESEKLWAKVSASIESEDQTTATTEKSAIENLQRQEALSRKERNVEWSPANFFFDGSTWKYKYEDKMSWDNSNDVLEYEDNFIIRTIRRHKTPIMRTAGSLISVNSKARKDSDQVVPAFHPRESNRQLVDLLRQLLAKQIEQSEQIEQLKESVANIQAKLSRPKAKEKDPFPITTTLLAVVFAVALQILMITFWFGDGKLFADISRKN